MKYKLTRTLPDLCTRDAHRLTSLGRYGELSLAWLSHSKHARRRDALSITRGANRSRSPAWAVLSLAEWRNKKQQGKSRRHRPRPTALERLGVEPFAQSCS
jgi:hypothetical protein